jgi:hypothetical protein
MDSPSSADVRHVIHHLLANDPIGEHPRGSRWITGEERTNVGDTRRIGLGPKTLDLLKAQRKRAEARAKKMRCIDQTRRLNLLSGPGVPTALKVRSLFASKLTILECR